MVEFLRKSEDLEATANEMVKEAITNGGPDNITIVLGEVKP
jgi:serine/threonine protein phosphatase PrpC